MKRSAESIAVVVLNYKGLEDTLSCVAALRRQTFENFKIVLVENGSHDGSAETFRNLAKSNLAGCEIIYNDKNLGFAGGVNTGIEWALANDFDAVALFNNDAIPDKKWLESLAKNLSSDIGIVTGLLLHADGKTIDSTGDYYSIWGLPFPRGRDQPAAKAAKSGYVFGASGGASLYSCEMFRDIGIFDDDFFAYFEDADISFRAQLSGWKVYYTDTAIAYHEQGGTSKKMGGFTVYQAFKNWPILFIKNVPNRLLFSVGIRFYFAYFVMFAHAIVRGNFVPAVKGVFAGIWYFWTSSIWKRWHVQRSRKVDATYIRKIMWHDMPPDQTGLRKLRKIFTSKP